MTIEKKVSATINLSFKDIEELQFVIEMARVYLSNAVQNKNPYCGEVTTEEMRTIFCRIGDPILEL